MAFILALLMDGESGSCSRGNTAGNRFHRVHSAGIACLQHPV